MQKLVNFASKFILRIFVLMDLFDDVNQSEIEIFTPFAENFRASDSEKTFCFYRQLL